MSALAGQPATIHFSRRPLRLAYQLARIGIALIFLWSGLSKTFDPGMFAETIEAFGLLPPVTSMPAAILLISAELLAGFGLLFEKRGALTAITLMMLMFLGVLSYGISIGLDIDCGCFGPGDVEARAFHDLRGAVRRDLLILFAIAYLYLWRFFNKLAPRPWSGRHSRQTDFKEV
jgi:uncharacterized membrane protein YphA (DoxX/SURF4 family)